MCARNARNLSLQGGYSAERHRESVHPVPRRNDTTAGDDGEDDVTDRRHMTKTTRLAALALATTALAACDFITAPPYQAPAAQNVEVTVAPGNVTVGVNEQVQFGAAVTGAAVTTVTWSVTCGSVTPGGLFTAPAAAGSCVVTAKSTAAPTVTGSSIVTVSAVPVPVAISISPATTAAVACKTVQFTATVTGSTNKAVTYAVQEAGGGTVNASGVYTAPADAGTFHVIATAAADTTKKATATVTVSTQIISVVVSPATVEVPPGGTAQLTATVTTSCGAVTAFRTLHDDGSLTLE